MKPETLLANIVHCCDIPAGASIPLNNPHAVSVSLPTMADVIGYEENDPVVLSSMQSGYPRFFMNKLVEKLCFHLREKHDVPDAIDLLPLMSHRALEIANERFGASFNFIEKQGSIFILIAKESLQRQAVIDFIRHSGILLSSRMAEDILLSLGLIAQLFHETLFEACDAAGAIKTTLGKAYRVEHPEQVMLCSCGMNAVYAVFEAMIRLNRGTEKQTILQAGWLYIDTLEIIRKFGRSSVLLASVTDMTKLEEKIISGHETIGAVFTEIPNNPLIECVDLPRLYDLCKRYDIPLVVDSTIGTPYNMNILPYCDVAIESLTKFACGKGDVLMGAVILNDKSSLAGELKELISPNIVQPYSRDTSRLAQNIQGYAHRVEVVAVNTAKIISYLEKSPAVKQVYSVLHPHSHQNFLKICKHPDALPGLISVVFNKPLVHFYDKLNLPKGPSLGTEFTLAMPYAYLAHYNLVKTKAGREELLEMGLDPELLRLSIGTEPAEEIIGVFRAAGI
jgi:cystathionine gamma-synthase